MGNEVSMAIDAGEGGAKYDAAAKLALSCKPFLARIMAGCLAEYAGLGDDEVMACIEGQPRVGEAKLLPGGLIKGRDTVSKAVGEGEVRFDVLYEALLPGGGDGRVGLIVNVEAQKGFPTSYPLVSRGEFYTARLISDQGWREARAGRYSLLKKVYSVWICTNPPAPYVDSVVYYEVNERVGRGDPPAEPLGNFDLQAVVRVCLGGPEGERGEGLLGMLATLFSDRYGATEKKRLLEDVYGIPMTGETGERVGDMCNLSLGVMEHGLAKGKAEERATIAANLLSMGLAPEKVAEGTKLPVDEVVKLKAEVERKAELQ